MESLIQDIRSSLRLLRKRMAWTLIIVMTLSLGIGASTAVFSFVYALLFQPLPYQDPDRLIAIWRQVPGLEGKQDVCVGDVMQWEGRGELFEAAAGYVFSPQEYVAVGDDVQLVSTVGVTDQFFSVLGVRPLLGRTFLPTEYPKLDRTPFEHVILTYDVWDRAYGRDPAIIGKSISLNGFPLTVVGVMPAGFRLFKQDTMEVFTPIGCAYHTWRKNENEIKGLARLKPGVEPAKAEIALNILAGKETSRTEESQGTPRLKAERLQEHLFGDRKPVLFVLAATVALILLAGCANVANLM